MSTTLESARPAVKTSGAKVVNAYLNFDGRCEEALEFYQQAVGAKVLAMIRFEQAPPGGGPGPEVPPHKIMHSAMTVGETTVMASDCYCSGQASFKGTSLALTATDDEAAERIFAALSAGGEICQPLGESFFASRFGVVTDKFGVCWMILANPRS